MLNVVKFIKDNPDNWEELLSDEPMHIRITRKGSLVMFQYTQSVSQPCEIVNECRGLILDEANDFKVVRYGFYRFYNYGEPGCADIDFGSAVVTEKIDGSLVMLYYYNGQWHWSTRGSFDAVDAPVNNTDRTFQDIIDDALKSVHIDYNNLDIVVTYSFELVSPESRVVIYYPEPKLYFLMARNNLSLLETNAYKICQKPASYGVYTYEQIEKLINEKNGAKFEGVVVCDKYGRRAKVKNLLWLKLHHTINNGIMTEENYLNLYFTGEHEEFLTYFPEFRDEFEYYVNKFEKLLFLSNKLDRLNISEVMTKKKLAELVNAHVHSGGYQMLLYRAYEHRAFKWFVYLDLGWYLLYFGGK